VADSSRRIGGIKEGKEIKKNIKKFTLNIHQRVIAARRKGEREEKKKKEKKKEERKGKKTKQH
jgi:hypothetical protein